MASSISSKFNPATSSSPLRTPTSNPQHKVNHNRQKQRNSQHRRSKAIIESTLPSHANALRAPVERHERVDHSSQRDEGEETCANLANAVAEVEEADGQAAEDDGEVEP